MDHTSQCVVVAVSACLEAPPTLGWLEAPVLSIKCMPPSQQMQTYVSVCEKNGLYVCVCLSVSVPEW